MDIIEAFRRHYDFPLDDFQVAGITALTEGRSTLVAAPTGAGKTVVGEFAIFQALQAGGKCFYTTPIKALSNQKFHDLVELYGPDKVGLLTGDNSVNGEAPIVVMTTEVLRNMLYEGSRTLVGLHAVVMDEVHYLADRERGAVWEEVIIQVAESVQLACLSATVSNAEEFGAWLRSVRDSCDVVISERRPVPLDHHYAVNDRFYPVFKERGKQQGKQKSSGGKKGKPGKERLPGVPNPEVVMLERRSGPSGRPSRSGRRQHGGFRVRAPRRSDLVFELRQRKWLPAIYFLFSRQGCNDAVDQLLRDGVRLTSNPEAQAIRKAIDERIADLEADDLQTLGYGPWAAGLERGIAAHHAGMVPVFKETVEELFVRGLVKVCFATETLALGINMPARTVVIERLEKWNGQRHELLTPGQFTQLTGRAGRRGLDTTGHAVVAYQRDVDFFTVASLVGRRIEPLRSSFAPSYNMAVNLLRRHTREEAERLLARSFAQYQADATVVGQEQRIARNAEALAGYAENLHSDHGDFATYWALRRELDRLESEGAKDRRRRLADAVEQGIAELREGDVVALPGEGLSLAVIVSRTESRTGTPLAGAVTEDRKLVRLGPREFDRPPQKVGWIPLPRSGGPRQSGYRKEVALALRGVEARGAGGSKRQAVRTDEATAQRIAELRDGLRAHPVHHDPALPEIEVWARRHDELAAETEKLQRQVRRRTGSLVRQFDRICVVLADLGYLTDDGADPDPTADGLMLAGLYSETDLVLAQVLRKGTLDGLDAPDLAAVASVFVYETRMKEPPPPVFPNEVVRAAVEEIAALWQDVVVREEAAKLPPTRVPDAGFAATIRHWAGGAELDDALVGSELTAGDFVRNAKQVADLLRQVRDVTSGTLSSAAHQAAKQVVRGVVAYTGL